eukprot:TRINITY_DN64772_c0_g1_i1.p1 TRINITY_DN64772_c0_g1~~TRINITY_DN64772_c0_g1_i1.p1  ORF type:complete len:259 (+),score=31.06 TRINITY_DN64772_c0_g1_i1:185-961(+)
MEEKDNEKKLQEELNALGERLKKEFIARSNALLEMGKLEEAQKDLKYMEKVTGYSLELYQQQLEIAISLDQLDEVLDFIFFRYVDSDWNPLPRVMEYTLDYDSRNKFPHDDKVTERHLKFIRWAKELGCELSKTNLVIYKPEFRGLNAAILIPENEVILTIPISQTMSSQAFYGSPLELLLKDQGKISLQWQPYIYLIIYFLEERNNPNSQWKPWLDIIPTRTFDHPTFFYRGGKRMDQGFYHPQTAGNRLCEYQIFL